jgi:ketosteroid isomerase-like protein
MQGEPTKTDLLAEARRFVIAFNRHDWDAVLAWFIPGAVWELSAAGFGSLETRSLVGHQAIRDFLSELPRAFDVFQTVHEEDRDLGNGVAFSVTVLRGRPHGSNAFVDSRYGIVWTWSDAKIARITNYNDIDEARAAAERLAKERG